MNGRDRRVQGVGAAEHVVSEPRRSVMPMYLLQDERRYLGLLEHPAPNVEPGDYVVLQDGRQALVTGRIEAGRSSRFAAILDVEVVQDGEGA